MVAQAGRCEYIDGILRLQVHQPAAAEAEAEAPPSLGWVTLSAEQKGGPRFFEEVAAAEVEALSESAGSRRCGGAAAGDASGESAADDASGDAAGGAAGDASGGASGGASGELDAEALRSLAEASEAEAKRACAAEDPGPLCQAPPPAGGGGAGVLNLDGAAWARLAEAHN